MKQAQFNNALIEALKLPAGSRHEAIIEEFVKVLMQNAKYKNRLELFEADSDLLKKAYKEITGKDSVDDSMTFDWAIQKFLEYREKVIGMVTTLTMKEDEMDKVTIKCDNDSPKKLIDSVHFFIHNILTNYQENINTLEMENNALKARIAQLEGSEIIESSDEVTEENPANVIDLGTQLSKSIKAGNKTNEDNEGN